MRPSRRILSGGTLGSQLPTTRPGAPWDGAVRDAAARRGSGAALPDPFGLAEEFAALAAVILIPAGPEPCGSPAAPEWDPLPELPRGASGNPPGTPGREPSGEIVTRAERFPLGGSRSGAGGAGSAEIAIRRLSPAESPETAGAISWALCSVGASAAGALRRGVGATLAFTAKEGRGFAAAEGPRLKFAAAVAFISGAAISGEGFTRRLTATAGAANWSFGAGIEGEPAHSAMLGSGGLILGGASEASGRTSVWRGWVQRSGSDAIVWRGWKASAPRGAGAAGADSGRCGAASGDCPRGAIDCKSRGA